jgi:xanthine dehydrogenase YagS FAD-binding subunit
VAVNPSDTAPALIALDARMIIRNRRGTRIVAAEEFFVGPGTDITRMTVLEPGDLLTAIEVPAAWAGATFYFEKIRDRNVWDFALASVASATVTTGGTIDRSRIVVNGVSPQPIRLVHVEDAVRGRPRDEHTAEMAGELAVAGARPLHHNAFKVPLMRNLVKRAVRGA